MLIEHLKQTFAERCRRNPQYSLRAFAASLAMDSSTLSALLRQKRPLTPKTAKVILEQLRLSDATLAERMILKSVDPDLGEHEADEYSQLSSDVFAVISSWEHFAILALLEIDGFVATSRSISQRLNIPLGVVMEATDRLQKLGLIRKKSQRWELTGKNLSSPSEVPNAHVRESNRQYMEKALESLDIHSVDQRDITGITMAIDRAKLPEAKALIRDFRRKLARCLESGSKTSVYRLNIQLFPLSKEGDLK